MDKNDSNSPTMNTNEIFNELIYSSDLESVFYNPNHEQKARTQLIVGSEKEKELLINFRKGVQFEFRLFEFFFEVLYQILTLFYFPWQMINSINYHKLYMFGIGVPYLLLALFLFTNNLKNYEHSKYLFVPPLNAAFTMFPILITNPMSKSGDMFILLYILISFLFIALILGYVRYITSSEEHLYKKTFGVVIVTTCLVGISLTAWLAFQDKIFVYLIFLLVIKQSLKGLYLDQHSLLCSSFGFSMDSLALVASLIINNALILVERT